MTPADLERIGRRMYGKRHWRSRLALNLGRDNATIHRWGKRIEIDPIVEVAVRGLLERFKLNQAAEKIVTGRLRKEGKLKPRTRKRKKGKRHARSKSVAVLDSDVSVGAGDAVVTELAPDTDV
jgi:hypothetical protein